MSFIMQIEKGFCKHIKCETAAKIKHDDYNWIHISIWFAVAKPMGKPYQRKASEFKDVHEENMC